MAQILNGRNRQHQPLDAAYPERPLNPRDRPLRRRNEANNTAAPPFFRSLTPISDSRRSETQSSQVRQREA